MLRRIAVITGTRAEYGLLYWIMQALRERDVEVQLIVTGAHLSARYGMTVNQIEADGISIAAKIDIGLEGDEPLSIACATGLAVSSMAAALARLEPQIVLLLGDRYEMLAAATAAALLRLPIAHIHGGEVTEGAIDESLRHAITKLSYWHFAATPAYAERIMQMGESPARVFTVGAPGIDNIAKLDLYSRADMEKMLGVTLQSPLILCTYHPETLSTLSVDQQMDEVIAAMECFPDAAWIITGANADAGGNVINDRWQAWAMRQKQAIFSASLGSRFYLSFMREADLVFGNSSSAMIEAPVMGKPVVNIGDRQTGRLRTPGILDCVCERANIEAAVQRALSADFKAAIQPATIFGLAGHVSDTIADHLAMLTIPVSTRKVFHDYPGATGPRKPEPASP